MKNKRIRTLAALLIAALICGSAAAYAASDAETAAAGHLAGQGIYEGDENGDLNLDKGLTRAGLAAILTRLDVKMNAGANVDGLQEWREWGIFHFAEPENRYNTFTDLPDWALPYVEYCYERGLVKGVSETQFDASGAVSPNALCAVILRYCGVPETDWEYGTAAGKAQSLGIAPDEGLDGDTVTRGTVALVVKGGMDYAESKKSETPTEALEAMSAPQLTPAPSEVPAMTIDEMKAEIVRLTNEEREKAGLKSLEVLPELMDCAQAKAQDFIDNHYFDHYSQKYGTVGEMIFSRVPNAGTAAENIGGWNKTPAGAFQSWMESTDGHKETMLTERLTHIGVGIAEGANGGYWWVQQFVAL